MNRPHAQDGPVLILGAGPIGLACALLLSMRGLRSQLIDARTLEQARQDRRLLALSRGTLQVLTGRLGERFAPMAPIRSVHVSSRGQFGATHMSSDDYGGVALGATVWYGDLVDALSAAAQSDPNIAVRRPCRATGIDQHGDAVVVQLDDGTRVEAALAINAEGNVPGTGTASRAAVLADLEVDGMAPALAVERFTRDGPLALLPLPAGPTAGSRTRKSMIWCVDQSLAQQLLALGDAEFVSKIQAMLGPRCTTVLSAGPRVSFPLLPQRRPRLREHRLVHIGNAAQSLHPVAGQGFNLGIRDCVCLADCLAREPHDPPAALSRYEATRKADRYAISTLTSGLPDLFGATWTPLAWARSLAMSGFDLVPPLRRSLSSLLMFGVRN